LLFRKRFCAFNDVRPAIPGSCHHSTVMTIESKCHVVTIAYIVTVTLFAIENVHVEHKKSACFIKRFECPGTDLNRYDRCGSQDFKSCVSTNSTTGARKKNPALERDLLSGRPGSNRPPQPWQGCALPNELLPHEQELLGAAKIGIEPIATKKLIYYLPPGVLYFGVYNVLSCTCTFCGVLLSKRFV
jgi:hypothetical protein